MYKTCKILPVFLLIIFSLSINKNLFSGPPLKKSERTKRLENRNRLKSAYGRGFAKGIQKKSKYIKKPKRNLTKDITNLIKQGATYLKPTRTRVAMTASAALFGASVALVFGSAPLTASIVVGSAGWAGATGAAVAPVAEGAFTATKYTAKAVTDSVKPIAGFVKDKSYELFYTENTPDENEEEQEYREEQLTEADVLHETETTRNDMDID